MDLSIASLNLQVIVMGVVLGMLIAWSIRWLFVQVALLVWCGVCASYHFLKKKRVEYQVAQREGKRTA